MREPIWNPLFNEWKWGLLFDRSTMNITKIAVLTGLKKSGPENFELGSSVQLR